MQSSTDDTTDKQTNEHDELNNDDNPVATQIANKQDDANGSQIRII